MPHGCPNQEMMLGFDFESDPFCAAPELLERIKLTQYIYKVARENSQTKQPREDANLSSVWKTQGV